MPYAIYLQCLPNPSGRKLYHSISCQFSLHERQFGNFIAMFTADGPEEGYLVLRFHDDVTYVMSMMTLTARMAGTTQIQTRNHDTCFDRRVYIVLLLLTNWLIMVEVMMMAKQPSGERDAWSSRTQSP